MRLDGWIRKGDYMLECYVIEKRRERWEERREIDRYSRDCTRTVQVDRVEGKGKAQVWGSPQGWQRTDAPLND